MIAVAADLHCHILPGLDDGAADLEDAVGMALQAQADGIQAICATPHIRHDHDVRIGDLQRRLDELALAVRGAGCHTRLLIGGEVAATSVAGLDHSELRTVSLGGAGRWILVEPAPGPLGDSLDDAVGQLRGRGYRAVIAHPERHLAEDMVPRLHRLIDHGAVVQATAASFTDPAWRDGMLALARAGVVHVLGTDSHSSRTGRPVVISGALSVLGSVAELADHLNWMAWTAPTAIVAGRDLTPPFPMSGR